MSTDLDLARERAILRWAADWLDYQTWADPTGQWSGPQAEAARAQKRIMLERLRRWADQLDAAPATYTLPAEPPEVTELWDCGGCRWERDKPGHWRWAAPGRAEPGHWHPDHPEPLIVPWYALIGKHGDLSTVPPEPAPAGGEDGER